VSITTLALPEGLADSGPRQLHEQRGELCRHQPSLLLDDLGDEACQVVDHDSRETAGPGLDRPPRPCTYSNKCLINQIENPLGCYEESRFDSHEQMVEQILSVFDPPPFPR